ncbi:MAG TPA: DNA alkylation repair protein [Pyrinomonadaceae bacterium]|nr:DNA alkylation repair protein [Pyrinomonadaceae bacterium]
MLKPVTEQLAAIRRRLSEASDEGARDAARKFVPTAARVYGVRMPVLNAIAREWRAGGFELAEALWAAGAFEERMLAAKLLGLICKQDPERALSLVASFSGEATDWAVCDTLATQGVRGIAAKKKAELLALAGRLIDSPDLWQRRFGLVLLTNYAKDRSLRPAVESFLERVKDDREHYVKKAVEWVRRDLSKAINTPR